MYRSVWESERYRKGLIYSGTGGQAMFPGSHEARGWITSYGAITGGE